MGDANMRTLQKGDVLQLERKGYFIVDEPLARLGRPAVLFAIPDGKPRPILEPPHADCYPAAGPVPSKPAVGNGMPAAAGAGRVETPKPVSRVESKPQPGPAVGARAVIGAAAALAQAAGPAASGAPSAAATAVGGGLRRMQPEGDVGPTPTPTPQPSGDLRSQM